jgi:hypothetical protein
MRPILILMLIALIVFASGCSSSTNSMKASGTPMTGTWAVTGSGQCTPSCGSPSGTYTVVLVSSPCSVTTPLGPFSVEGPVCFIANNNSGNGSISGTGLPTTSKNNGQGVLIGVPADPVPSGATANLLFVAAFGSNFVEFTGSGKVTNKTLSGTGSCDTSTPACQGVSVTFSATLQ